MTEQPDVEEVSQDILASFRVAHLQMIQGVIDRMAGYCASLKNFCVTIVAALLAVGLDREQGMRPLVLMGFILLFGVLDAYYLGLERRYRTLFNDVRGRPLARAHEFDMAAPPSTLSTFISSVVSISVGAFYLMLLTLAAIVLFLYRHG